MRPLLCFSLAVLFLANSVPSGAQGPTTTAASAPAAAADPVPVAAAEGGVPPERMLYDVGRTFALNCTVSHAQEGVAYQWRKNGSLVEELRDLRGRYRLEDGGLTFRLTERSTEDDYGNYSVGAAGAGAACSWQLEARVHAKVPADVNVVEGQKLKLLCRLLGKPYPAVAWTYRRNAEDPNVTDVTVALGERVKLSASEEQGVEGAALVVEVARREDAGLYTCRPLDPGATPATVTLRVKDMYAALWPFLGICAEVFVLCAIILVYEKRRTKPELDDSDTDNHDQKKS